MGDDGRRAPLDDACPGTQKVLRLSDNSNGYQESENSCKFNDKSLKNSANNENDVLSNGTKEKLTIPKVAVAESSESLSRGFLVNGVIRTEDENGTKLSKNKLWTNKVDGIAKKAKGNAENEDNEQQIQPTENNVKTFFSNLLKFSLKRLYPVEDVEANDQSEDDCTGDDISEGAMGNLQSGEGRKNKDGGKSPSKKRGGFLSKKSPAKETKSSVATPVEPSAGQKPTEEPKVCPGTESGKNNEFSIIHKEEESKVVSPEGIVGAEDPTVTGPNGNVNSVDPAQQTDTDLISDAKFVSTDSWKQIQTFETNKDRLDLNFEALSPQSRESSSESVFTDPLTPRTLAEMKTEKTVGSGGSSTISKSTTTSQRQETEFDDTSSLDDVTLIDDQLTDTEADDSVTAVPEKSRSASLDVSETSISVASAPCHRPTSFSVQKFKKVDGENLTSKYFSLPLLSKLRSTKRQLYCTKTVSF